MATATITGPEQVDEGRVEDRGAFRTRSPEEVSRRRFTLAVVTGTALTAPFMLWLLWDLWSGKVDVLRGISFDYFYDLQARAMFHGHLWVPNGDLSIEAFVHNGHQFTYFGIFPSLIRMPVLLLTSRFDGDLTAPSLLLAWLATALFTALLLWRLRILIRGTALVGRAEAASYGVLMAGVMGGSVVLYLSATPFVYNEDFAWSIALTVGTLFALLGVQERPSWGRITATAVLVVCTNLDRTPTGYAVVIGCILVAAWFALGKGGTAARRWAIPLVAVGLIGFLVNVAVTYAKFGIPVGLPMADQTWTHLNAYRRHFLAANGGKAYNLNHIPSQVWAYFQPFGARFSTLFPFITPPGAPASVLDGAVMEWTYPTASMTTTAPLFIVLGVWGAVTAFRRRGPGRVHLARLIMVTGAVATAGVLVWGYISQRYLGDLMPLFIVASAVGMIEVWRLLEGRSRRARRWALGGLCAVAAYGVAANVAVSAWPVPQWTQTQSAGFVRAQQLLSIGSLGASVRTGGALPNWAPSGELFAVNHCSGLYMSSGDDMSSVPGQFIDHYDTWMTVEQSNTFTRKLEVTFNSTASRLTQPVTLMTYGKASLVLVPVTPHSFRLVLENSGTKIPWPAPHGWIVPVLYSQYQFTVTVDPNLHSLLLTWYGSAYIDHYIAGRGPIVVQATPQSHPGPTPVVTVSALPMASPANPLSLCHSLVGNR